MQAWPVHRRPVAGRRPALKLPPPFPLCSAYPPHRRSHENPTQPRPRPAPSYRRSARQPAAPRPRARLAGEARPVLRGLFRAPLPRRLRHPRRPLQPRRHRCGAGRCRRRGHRRPGGGPRRPRRRHGGGRRTRRRARPRHRRCHGPERPRLHGPRPGTGQGRGAGGLDRRRRPPLPLHPWGRRPGGCRYATLAVDKRKPQEVLACPNPGGEWQFKRRS